VGGKRRTVTPRKREARKKAKEEQTLPAIEGTPNRKKGKKMKGGKGAASFSEKVREKSGHKPRGREGEKRHTSGAFSQKKEFFSLPKEEK